jgi:two-component system response regulator BaeR
MNAEAARNILIVEDEVKLARLLAEYLESAGYRTHHLADGRPVADWVRREQPDLVLLDLLLPGRDGMEVCRDIRAFSAVPVFMLTARIEEIDRLLGLDLGADDYICKPYSPREVAARVRALFRRIDGVVAGGSAEGGFRVDDDRLAIHFGGQPLDLTPGEYRVLRALLARPGKVYSRDYLLDRLHEDSRAVLDRTIDSHIKNLRRKLRAVAGERELIVSVYGVGYRIDG